MKREPDFDKMTEVELVRFFYEQELEKYKTLFPICAVASAVGFIFGCVALVLRLLTL